MGYSLQRPRAQKFLGGITCRVHDPLFQWATHFNAHAHNLDEYYKAHLASYDSFNGLLTSTPTRTFHGPCASSKPFVV